MSGEGFVGPCPTPDTLSNTPSSTPIHTFVHAEPELPERLIHGSEQRSSDDNSGNEDTGSSSSNSGNQGASPTEEANATDLHRHVGS